MVLKFMLGLGGLLVSLCTHCGQAQIPIFDVRVENLLKMQEGIGWPVLLHVVKGNEALMQLTKTLPNMEACEVLTPTGLKFDVRNPSSGRFERWGDGCGVRVRKVEVSDHGRWRMVAIAGNNTIQGWSELHVEDNGQLPTQTETIHLQDDKAHVDVELTTLNNSYCLVTQPFSESSLVPGHCRVTLDRTSRAVQGRWNVVIGLPGRVTELHMERNVAVETEQLVSGYKEDASKLHLYCNILHTEKNVTFCRFQKNSQNIGYNIMDGLSDGSFSYYGKGFSNRQCGMTIETPAESDYTTWRCTVGLQEWSGNKIEASTPMQALFKVSPSQRSTKSPPNREDLNKDDEEKTVFVQRDSSFTLMCRGETSLAYCWFQHPNGTTFTPVERQRDEERAFWYTGDGLQIGECGITFTHVSEDDDGDWVCHMGPKHQLGIEHTEKIRVNVTGPLAASKKQIGVILGEEATLYCHTANGPRPLDYCRFLNPNFVGINIDSSVTAKNPILNRFYFTPERSLDYGDCSLTIKPVLQEDIGQWTCAGLLHDAVDESRDSFVLYKISATRRLSTAGIFGMSFGFIVLALVLVGVVWFKKGKPIPWRRVTDSRVTFNNRFSDARSGDLTPTPRSSNGSQESSTPTGQITINTAAA